MNDYIIMTDSSCDFPAATAEELGITVIPLIVNIEGRDYVNELDGRELPFPDFYAMLRSGSAGKTSAPSVERFTAAMEPVLESGRDILYIGFSSGLSATYTSGRIAADIMAEKYPDRKILTVDSLCASLGQGLLIYLTVQEKKSGKTVEEAADFAEKTKLHICHWFTVGDLQHLYRGGRISKMTATVGTVLNIKPVMHMDNEGHLAPVTKVRGRKAYLEKMCAIIRETAVDYKDQYMFISHGDCLEAAQELAEYIKRELGVQSFLINYVGPVIGAHSGPDTLALFFVGTSR